MNTRKILLIFAASIVTLSLLGGIAATFAWQRFGQEYFSQLQKQYDEFKKEAADFGRRSTIEGCLLETVERNKSTITPLDYMKQLEFIKACLPTSGDSPQFCERFSGGLLDSLSAVYETCDEFTMDEELCEKVVRNVQRECSIRKVGERSRSE